MSNHLSLIKAETRFTKWFRGDIKPAHPGVYQRDNGDQTGTSYSLWNGEFWCVGRDTASAAARMRNQHSYFQNHAWRGLLKETKA